MPVPGIESLERFPESQTKTCSSSPKSSQLHIHLLQLRNIEPLGLFEARHHRRHHPRLIARMIGAACRDDEKCKIVFNVIVGSNFRSQPDDSSSEPSGRSPLPCTKPRRMDAELRARLVHTLRHLSRIQDFAFSMLPPSGRTRGCISDARRRSKWKNAHRFPSVLSDLGLLAGTIGPQEPGEANLDVRAKCPGQARGIGLGSSEICRERAVKIAGEAIPNRRPPP